MDLDDLGSAKYLSLTTYRKDGTPVATPVWLVRDGDALRVITDAGSGKAKRLRNNGDVLVAPCDMRGRLKGEAVPARAVLEDAAETARTRDLVAKRYGLLGRWMLRKGNDARVGIRITAG